MLEKYDIKYLESDFLVNFCKSNELDDIDCQYYLKLAYDIVKNKLDKEEIRLLFSHFYDATEEQRLVNELRNE